MSPQAMKDKQYSQASDVYSFGVTCWEIFNRKENGFYYPPYGAMEPLQICIGVSNGGLRLTLPSKQVMGNEVHDLISKCLQFETSERPTFQELQSKLDVLFENEHKQLKERLVPPPNAINNNTNNTPRLFGNNNSSSTSTKPTGTEYELPTQHSAGTIIAGNEYQIGVPSNSSTDSKAQLLQ